MSLDFEMQKLVCFWKKFLTLSSPTIEQANNLEALLGDRFPENDVVDDIVLMLASYRPGGGDYLYDENRLLEKMKQIENHPRLPFRYLL